MNSSDSKARVIRDEEINPLKKLRAAHKRKVTIKIKTLNQQLDNDELDNSLYKSQLKDIEKERDSIRL